jgi:serine/threonine-protein kinase
MSPEKLGRYEITDKIGEGAMGIVYRAFDPLLERVVAIKTIKLDLTPAEQEEFERRFFKEAKSAARLNHPAIVTVFDAGKVDDTAYIAMEFLEGRDLRQLIVKDQLLPPERVVDIVAQVADGLDYAHRNGVVHRDVKPANIIVLANDAVKIADFGIAQLQSGAKTMTGNVLGTPKYMSPEQIMGKPVDGRSDIFSLGVVLYQLLTGVSPFDASSVSTIMYRVIHEPAVMPSLVIKDVSRAFEYILARALAKVPEQRYATAADMAADLRRFRELEADPGLPLPGGGIGGQEVALIQGGEGDATVIESTDTIPVRPSGGGDTAATTVRLAAPPAGPAAAAGAATVPNRPSASRRGMIIGAAVLALAVAAGAVLLGGPSRAPDAAATAGGAATPAATPAGTGVIAIAVAPWGEVFVDGASAGISPPLTELMLAAGRHRIEIRNGDLPPFVQQIDLAAGDTQKIKPKF